MRPRILNPVPVFDFDVLMTDAGPDAQFGRTDIASALVGIGQSILFASFAEVSGLNAEMEVEEYREGGNNAGPHKFIKWGTYPNLVFRRGVTANADLWDWHYAVVYKTRNPVRKNGIVLLTDRGSGPSALTGGPTPLGLPGVDRLPIAAWFFRNALPQRIQGPQLNAKSNEIAIETLELVHEGLYRLGPAVLPGIGDALGAVGF